MNGTMKLRIIAGQLKRRTIEIADAKVEFRPTKEMVREAVANFLQSRVSGARVADIAAGSGIFGFEMLSRGASLVHFIDNNAFNCSTITENARHLAIENQSRVFCKEISTYIKSCTDTYDIIYYDPPYHDEQLQTCVVHLLRLLAEDGVLVYEHEKKLVLPESFSGTDFLHETRCYGKTVIDYFIHTTQLST